LLDPDLLREICKFDNLINIRKEEWSAAFEIFVKVVLPPVVRKNYFKVKKYDFKISEFVLIADEAFGLVLLDNYAGGFIGSHSKKTSSSPFFGVEVSTIMSQ